ncbi:PAS domain S-box protein [Sulfurimonas sp.]|nr:PAS domain S-box protein [Sulfurimonas sp.]
MDKVVPKNEEFIYEGRVAISQTDVDGNITFVNRKFCEISGYTSTELIESNHDIIRHPSAPNEVFDKMWTALKSGQVWNGPLKNLRKDGMFYWVDMEIAPIFDDQEQVTGYISVSKPSPRKNIKENEKIFNNNQTKK